MSHSKNKLSNSKSLIIATPLIFALGLIDQTNSFANNSNSIEDCIINSWHPYSSYLNVSVPQDKLNQELPVGITLGELLNIVETTYIEGEAPLYVNGILVSNKKYKLPSTFNPGEVPEARQKFEEMKAAASKDSIQLNAFSTFRSYQRQEALYARYVARDGQEKADTYSARPGHSEHQTGLTFDIGGADSSCYASTRFTGTKEELWLRENAHKYGFVLRYHEGKEHITGYMHESWHFRYVGTEWSAKIYESGLTIEEFLGLDKLSEIESFL